jgi:hypothetical protein
LAKFLESIRRTASDSRPALIAGAILCAGVMLYLALTGSNGQEIWPYVAAAVVAGATLFIIKQVERRRAPKDLEETEPPATTAIRSLPPSAQRATANRRTIESHRIVAVDYAYHILGGAAAPPDLPAAAEAEWRSFRERGLSRIPSPQELSEFFARYGMITPQRLHLIDDYRHYGEHHEHRRPEMWAQRKQWFS